MELLRPTLRCLQEELKLPIPRLTEPLDAVDHPLLNKARQQFADPAGSRERIAAIDDRVLFKAKVQRWRGAIWMGEHLPWLLAAGVREAGSADDFYSALAADGRQARALYNAVNARALTTETSTAHLLPRATDRQRYKLEATARFVRALERAVPDLIRASLRDGREHTTTLPALTLGAQVRADDGHETYVAIRISGSVPLDVTAVVLEIVPGCDPSGWYPEVAMPDRPLLGNEQAWSNIMDPSAAAKLLDLD